MPQKAKPGGNSGYGRRANCAAETVGCHIKTLSPTLAPLVWPCNGRQESTNSTGQ